VRTGGNIEARTSCNISMIAFSCSCRETNVLALYRESFALKITVVTTESWFAHVDLHVTVKNILCRELLQTTLPMHGVYWSNCSCLIRAGTATKFSWNGHHPTIIGLSARWRILKAWSLLRSWFCWYVASASCRAFAVNGETYVDGSWPGVRPTNPQIANLAL
jgi:hypothetical protein